MVEVFIQLAIILLTAFLVSYIVRLFKQPIVVGYIIAGVIISPFIAGAVHSDNVIGTFSDIGIAFLLFIVGLHLNPRVIKEVGVPSLVIGILQIGLTFVAGFFVSTSLFGFDILTSAYVGIALAFSSTIIIMKLLSDRGHLDTLYGKISIGILIIQDLVAIAVLVVISSFGGDVVFASFALKGIVGGIGTVVLIFVVGFFIIPPLTHSIAKSQELLFLFSICWCFLIAAIFAFLGFSIEIGALIAGIALSVSPYSTEISAKIRPLRDFFLIIFFIILGLNIDVTNLQPILLNAIILSLIALVLKPFILIVLMAFAGYTKRNNFLVGSTLAQISEFSLIVLALGFSLGHITSEIVSTLTLTAVITITLSTYMIMYSDVFYDKLKRGLSIFERKKPKKDRDKVKKYDAILFGYNRIGFNILRSLKKIKNSYLVVDFNPDTIADLTKLRVPCLYGDVFDSDFLDDLPLKDMKMAVSTIPDFETNMLLIEKVRLINPDAVILVRAHQIREALQLYKKGANYVLTPHFLGGEYLSRMIGHFKTGKAGYKNEKQKHIKILMDMLEKGHEHPEVEKD